MRQNGRYQQTRNGRQKNFNATTELQELKAICGHPLVKAAMIQVVANTSSEAWQKSFPRINPTRAKQVVAQLTAEESIAGLALIARQASTGTDLSRKLTSPKVFEDPTAVQEVAQASGVPVDSLRKLAEITQPEKFAATAGFGSQ